MAAPAPKSAASSRLRFSAQDDIALLQEVHATKRFKGAGRWVGVANNLLFATGKSFSPRAVRDRFDLLLAQFASEDRANLRKSGTEEQYSETEHLLQELSDLAKEFKYRYKVAATKKVNSSLSRQRPRYDALARCSASAFRDSAAAAHMAASAVTVSLLDNAAEGPDCTPAFRSPDTVADLLQLPRAADNIWSTCVMDTAESISASTGGDTYEVAADGPTIELATAAHTYARSPSRGSAECNTTTSPEPPDRSEPDRVQRGKKRENENLQFFERRLEFEKGLREKEMEQEERRIALDEKRFSLDERRLTLEEERLLLDREKHEQHIR
ncbi:unnamed protein product, partial [Ixodes hexagonus]